MYPCTSVQQETVLNGSTESISGALAGALRNLSGALGASVASARDARPGPYDRGTARGAEGAVPGARGAEPMEGKGAVSRSCGGGGEGERTTCLGMVGRAR